MKILFFIGTLQSGGKERRLIELLSYLKMHTSYEMMVVLRQKKIDYQTFNNLDIPFKVLTEKYIKKDIRIPFNFLKICVEYKPDVIHSWGAMPATVALLSIILKRIPHLNSQITSAPRTYKKCSLSTIQNKINFKFSDIILSNSLAGLDSFHPPKSKSKVIYNGVNPERFYNLPDKDEIRKKYNIKTSFAVVMVASFTDNKDFDLFINIASYIYSIRKDISFVCVGGGKNLKRIKDNSSEVSNIIFTGRIDDVEAIINSCDIGVLFSTKGEGISNSILEYMALGKPVIANDAGGNNEIISHQKSGLIITYESSDEIGQLIIGLINSPEIRERYGIEGKRIIQEKFSLDRMGQDFEKLYSELI